jgi:hypothetical protein
MIMIEILRLNSSVFVSKHRGKKMLSHRQSSSFAARITLLRYPQQICILQLIEHSLLPDRRGDHQVYDAITFLDCNCLSRRTSRFLLSKFRELPIKEGG